MPTRLELPFCDDNRFTGRVLAIFCFILVPSASYWIFEIKLGDWLATGTIALSSLVIAHVAFLSFKGRYIEIAASGMTYIPDSYLIPWGKHGATFYQPTEVYEVVLLCEWETDSCRGAVELKTVDQKSYVLSIMYPSQAWFLGHLIAKTYSVPINTEAFVKNGWHKF